MLSPPDSPSSPSDAGSPRSLEEAAKAIIISSTADKSKGKLRRSSIPRRRVKAAHPKVRTGCARCKYVNQEPFSILSLILTDTLVTDNAASNVMRLCLNAFVVYESMRSAPAINSQSPASSACLHWNASKTISKSSASTHSLLVVHLAWRCFNLRQNPSGPPFSPNYAKYISHFDMEPLLWPTSMSLSTVLRLVPSHGSEEPSIH